MSLPGLLVTGTDTGVGKTQVAAAIARCMSATGRHVGVLKPVATGAVRTANRLWSEDAEALVAAIECPPDLAAEAVAPLRYEAPVAPSIAARLAGEPLRFDRVLSEVSAALDWWASRAEVMVIEGVGGFLCPLAEGATLADLAVALDLPVLIVARKGLGTLNHTLLTVEAVKLRALRIAGIVINNAESAAETLAESTALEELALRLEDVAILADLAFCGQPSLLWEKLRDVDWYGWSRASRGPVLPLERVSRS